MATIDSDDDIRRIVARLQDRTLPKAEWTHAAHFAAGLWLLRAHGAQAIRIMPPLIRCYNESTGVANTDTSGYHQTITIASLAAAAHWLAATADPALTAVLRQLMGSPMGRSDWLFAYWSRPVLFSVEARSDWVSPDLKPFVYARFAESLLAVISP